MSNQTKLDTLNANNSNALLNWEEKSVNTSKIDGGKVTIFVAIPVEAEGASTKALEFFIMEGIRSKLNTARPDVLKAVNNKEFPTLDAIFEAFTASEESVPQAVKDAAAVLGTFPETVLQGIAQSMGLPLDSSPIAIAKAQADATKKVTEARKANK